MERMNKPTKSPFRLLCLSCVLALAVVGCGTAEQAANENEAAGTSAAEPSVATEAAPVPELRTNDAGAVLVTQEEMLRMIDAGTAPAILDVRTAEEFAEGHVPGAINISHDELADRLAEIEAVKEAGVIVYCRSGRRAGIAEELLLGQGFGNVQHLEGDMLAWLAASRPTEKQQ
jgi:rhodanese-related sulfurtransferase